MAPAGQQAASALGVLASAQVDGKSLGGGLGVTHAGWCPMVQTRIEIHTLRELPAAFPTGGASVQVDMTRGSGKNCREITGLTLQL